MRYPPVGPVTAVYSADVSLPLATTWALTTTPPLESKTVPAIVPRSDCARDTPVHTRQKTPSKMKRKNKDFDCIAPPRPVATQRGTRRAALCTEEADHTFCDRFSGIPIQTQVCVDPSADAQTKIALRAGYCTLFSEYFGLFNLWLSRRNISNRLQTIVCLVHFREFFALSASKGW